MMRREGVGQIWYYYQPKYFPKAGKGDMVKLWIDGWLRGGSMCFCGKSPLEISQPKRS